MKKLDVITFLLLTLVSCRNEVKGNLQEKSPTEPEKSKSDDNQPLVQNESLDTILWVNHPKTMIGLRLGSIDDYIDEFKITKDTIDLGLYGEALIEIKLEERAKIEQRYKNEMVIRFDDKTYPLRNWKKYYSPWVDNWYKNDGTNVHTYSYFDRATFPHWENNELMEAVNNLDITELQQEAIVDSLRNSSIRVYPSLRIVESQFKIVFRDKLDSIYLIVRH